MKRTLDTNTVDIKFFQFTKRLLELYEHDKQFMVKGELHKCSYHSMHKWMLAQTFSRKDLILRNMLLDAMISADNSVPGSGSYVPWFIYNNFEKETPIRKSSRSYLDMTLQRVTSEYARTTFETIYENCGPLTKMDIKLHPESDVVLKYRNSYRFPIAPDVQFQTMVGNVDHIDLVDPIVITIEGAPETVAEINPILQWNHESKRPVVLVARSFQEEIIATLATNWIRGSLTVLPVRYGDTIETINMAADLCAVTGAELISPHFGDVVSAAIMNRDKWGEIESFRWVGQESHIRSSRDTTRHRRSLMIKRDSIEEEELKDLYSARIMSLSSDAFEIKVPDVSKTMLSDLDSMIKHYGAFVVSGAIETPLGYLPSSFVDSAKASAETLKDTILNIGGFLVRVDDEVVAGRK